MSALEDLLSDFTSNVGTMPAVNPPEAAKVLATQTAPEVAGEPEPAPVEDKPAPPTEKPADVVAAEAAKTRKPRAPRQTKPAEPAPAGTQPAAPYAEGNDLSDAIRLVASLLPKGSTLQIVGEA